MALSATINTLGRYTHDLLPLPASLFQVSNFLISFAVILLLFTVSNALIGLYLERFSIVFTYSHLVSARISAVFKTG